MPTGITQKVMRRKKAVLDLLASGCKPTSYIVNALKITHTEAFYVLNTLAAEGHIKKWIFGKTAIWCPNDVAYKELVDKLKWEVMRIVEINRLKYVYPMRLYKLILNDVKAYVLLSRLVPLDRRNSAALSFLNHILSMLYGKPYYKGEKTVYITTKTLESQPKATA
jgi:hypothetical protein